MRISRVALTANHAGRCTEETISIVCSLQKILVVLLFCLVIKTIFTDANNADLCLGINMMGDYHEKTNRTPFKIFTCRCMLLELYMSILATELFSPLIKIEFRTKITLLLLSILHGQKCNHLYSKIINKILMKISYCLYSMKKKKGGDDCFS